MNGQLVKLSAHLKVSSVYTSLALSAVRAYPQKILLESEDSSKAARQLFRMPLPLNEYEAGQEVGYRTDMAFAALRFLNDRYSHVVEQRNDVVKEKDWAIIIKREDRVEDGAIAIARAADANVQSATVHMELDRIADLVRQRIVEMEAAAVAKPAPVVVEESNARPAEIEDNHFSLQAMTDLYSEATIMPSWQPDNRHSLLEAAARVANEAHGFYKRGTRRNLQEDAASMEVPESSLAHSYAARAAEVYTHTQTNTNTHTHTHSLFLSHMHTCTHTYTHTHTKTHTHAHTYIHTHTHTNTHKHTHTHAHTQTHTHTLHSLIRTRVAKVSQIIQR